MLACVFCRCQLPAATARTKYVEHLQVALLPLAQTLPTMQDWHMIMVPGEVEVAVTRALEEAGLGRSARRMMEEARRGQEHHTVTAKVEVQDSFEEEVVVVREVQRKPKQGW